MIEVTEELKIRFFGFINKTNTCWLWTGATDRGYGRFNAGIGNTCAIASRVSFIIHNPTISIVGYDILHKCDMPSCVNPEHLYKGNQLDNISDMIKRGRYAKGFNNGTAFLTWEEVCEMRKMFDTGLYTKKAIALKFNCNPKTAVRIINKQSRLTC